jgi:hypothetical protein
MFSLKIFITTRFGSNFVVRGFTYQNVGVLASCGLITKEIENK